MGLAVRIRTWPVVVQGKGSRSRLGLDRLEVDTVLKLRDPRFSRECCRRHGFGSRVDSVVASLLRK